MNKSSDSAWDVDPIRRLSLARRVARQLSDLAEDVLVEVVGEPARVDLPDSLVSDFLVTSYDLEMRISLLVGGQLAGSQALEGYLEKAQGLLDLYPETDAVVLVADDADLTSVVVEPFDREVALRLEGVAGAPPSRHCRGALRELVQTYLRDMSPVWSAFSALVVAERADIAQLTSSAAVDALIAQKGENVRVPEKRAAQAQLSSRDATFVASLCAEVVRGEGEPARRITEWVAGA